MKSNSTIQTTNQCFGFFLNRIPLVGIILLLMALSIPAWATPPEQSQRNQDQEGQRLILSKANVTIEKKSLQHIFIGGGKIEISPETLIVGLDGKEVSIKKMLVPCDAEVSYTIENGARVAHRINIKRVADGASWQWTSEKPE